MMIEIGRFKDEMEAEKFMLENALENGEYKEEMGWFIVYDWDGEEQRKVK